VHSSLIAFGHQVPMADLFGVAGRKLLAELDFPEPWRSPPQASLELIDDLERRIAEIERWLRRTGPDHRYIPLLMSAPGIGWVTGFTIAAEIGDINRFSSPIKLTGYTGLCPREVPVRRDGPTRPALQARPEILALGIDGGGDRRLLAPALQAALPAHQAPPGPPARPESRADRARKLTEAIWYMLTRNQPFKPFAPADAVIALTA
jgi:transposase